MLKIKDNVDLNELKKFGFSSDYGKFVLYYHSIWIGVDVNRELILDISDGDIEEGTTLVSELIYDLTTAGLIEKG